MTIKKISTLLILSVLPLGVLTAQEEKDYLPQAGDWAVGIDMQPVYALFGNIANGTAGNGLGQFGGEDPLLGGISIMGKMMLDKTTALRVNVGIGKDLDKTYRYQYDDEPRLSQSNPVSEQKVEDLNQHNRAVYSLAAGIEFRKGKDRIQGYFGGDVVFGMRKDRYKFSYGNALTDMNQLPTRTNYNNAGPAALAVNPIGYWSATYATEKYQNTLVAGIAGKVGVEYFIVPKISFGGEVSLLISEQFVRGAYTKSEGYNPTTAVVEEHTELVSPASRTFHMGTEDMGGKLFMMFYF